MIVLEFFLITFFHIHLPVAFVTVVVMFLLFLCDRICLSRKLFFAFWTFMLMRAVPLEHFARDLSSSTFWHHFSNFVISFWTALNIWLGQIPVEISMGQFWLLTSSSDTLNTWRSSSTFWISDPKFLILNTYILRVLIFEKWSYLPILGPAVLRNFTFSQVYDS